MQAKKINVEDVSDDQAKVFLKSRLGTGSAVEISKIVKDLTGGRLSDLLRATPNYA